MPPPETPRSALPRFELFEKPSPLQHLPAFSARLGGGIDVWIKREDLLPLAFGGNKLRNLEYLVGAAAAAGADTLVTSGRRWSNHCRLTAAAGAKAGLGVHLVLSGPPAEPPGPGIRLAEILGASIHQLATAERAERDATVDRVVAELTAGGHRPYVIGVGGSGLPGTYGQFEAANELFGQLAAVGVVPRAVFVPSATGGTQAGQIVANGIAAAIDGPIVGVLVARPEAELRPSVEAQVADLARFVGAPPVSSDAVVLDGSQMGDGYGRPTAAAEEATRLLASTEGILVDPIYTAKALAALVARARSGELAGQAVVFWHAGGTPGLFEPLD
jgi:1-aminocyclopropane-1-carboxylate deaminase/D-cysteine desulfhydrase-like pyridoxal-dependent ACC family enzyme